MTGIFTTLQQNAEAISQAVRSDRDHAGDVPRAETFRLIEQTGLDIVIALAQGIAQSMPELIPAIVGMMLEIVQVLTEPDTVIALNNAALQIILAVAEGLDPRDSGTD